MRHRPAAAAARLSAIHLCVQPITLLLLAGIAGGANAGASFQRAFAECQAEDDSIARLRCYDALTPPATDDQQALEDETVPPMPDIDREQRALRIARLEALSRREERGALTSDDPNYLVYAVPVDDNIGDEAHYEFFVSLKYPLVDDWFGNRQDDFRRWENVYGRFFNGITPDRLLVHYNGLWDFYAAQSNRFDSAPIISRAQNPGISVEYDFASGHNQLRLGWFHESNGQTLEENDLASFERLRREGGDDFALSRVSRGWDYALLRWSGDALRYEDPLLQPWINYRVEMRYYCDCQGFGFVGSREDDIWWEEGNDARITDFDGLRGMVEGSLWRSPETSLHINARLELRTGLEHSTGQYWTGKLSLGAEWENLSATLFYFDGYGRDPSTYHLRTRYAGLGVELR